MWLNQDGVDMVHCYTLLGLTTRLDQNYLGTGWCTVASYLPLIVRSIQWPPRCRYFGQDLRCQVRNRCTLLLPHQLRAVAI